MMYPSVSLFTVLAISICILLELVLIKLSSPFVIQPYLYITQQRIKICYASRKRNTAAPAVVQALLCDFYICSLFHANRHT